MIKNLSYISLALLCALFLNTPANAANYSYDMPTNTNSYSSLQGNVVYIPADTKTTAILAQPLSSTNCFIGSNVYATLNTDFTYNNLTIAPAGSTINGTITKVKKAGFGNRNGQIEVKFTSIRTPSGYSIPITASIATTDGKGVLKGGTKIDSAKDYTKNAAIGAAGGAILGTAMGPLSGGSVGKGAVYGTALGGGLGLINAARQKGENVEIPANSIIEIQFDQPITVSAPSGY